MTWQARRRAGLLLMLGAVALAGCRLPGSTPAAPDSPTTAALQTDATGEPSPSALETIRERVPLAALAQATTPVACGLPPAQMVDGQRPMAPDESGEVRLVLGADGDPWTLATTLTGEPDRLVRIRCERDGVRRPEIVTVYLDAGEPVATLDLASVDYPDGESYDLAWLSGAPRVGDSVWIRWETAGEYSRILRWRGG